MSIIETLILNHLLLEDEISLCYILLQNSTQFKYLSSYISQNEPNTRYIEINHHIQMTYVKFATMTILLQNSKIHFKTRVKFMNSFTCSRLMYSWQNWNLAVSQFEKLIVTYHNLLRRLIEGRFKHIGNNDRDFQYKLNNEKVHVICCTSDVSSFIRKQQKDYASHVVRMHTERCDNWCLMMISMKTSIIGLEE